MLADVLTMREHSDKPLSEIAFAYLGDARNNMGNSLLVTGALLGMDVRIVAPHGAVAPPTTSSRRRRELAAATGARITLTEDVAEGVRGRRLRLHRRVGLHGRAQGGLGRADRRCSRRTR